MPVNHQASTSLSKAVVVFRRVTTDSLHEAIRSGDISAVEKELQMATIEQVNSLDSSTGELPLSTAMKKCNEDPAYPQKIVELLLEKKACVLQEGKDGKCPSHYNSIEFNWTIIGEFSRQAVKGCGFGLPGCTNSCESASGSKTEK
jgi:hypothetical protein